MLNVPRGDMAHHATHEKLEEYGDTEASRCLAKQLLEPNFVKDIHSLLASLHRPRILMRAARIGAQDYRRTGHLPRLLGVGGLPRHAEALMCLIEVESELETQRTSGDPCYSLVRHVDVLIAIVGEARELRATKPYPQLV